jgi:hypothetical protein
MPTSAAPETCAGLAFAGKLPTLLCWHGLPDAMGLTYDTGLGGYRTDVTPNELKRAPKFSKSQDRA